MRSAALAFISSLPVLAQLATPIASYDIRATLDPSTHTISGDEILTWLNDSPEPASTLQFHLYMNAFSNTRSTFFRESGGQLRGDRFSSGKWGWIRVESMRVENGPDLTAAIRFIAPDDGNAGDRTVIEVPLPQPAAPGAVVRLVIRFTTRLPAVFARTGYHGDFHLAGQWYPKLGVWEAAGFRYSKKGAWNCHQFHANSEFFANFGDYRVTLTVPSRFVVGATGEQVSRSDDAVRKTSTYTFIQPSVTDFAWTAQPGYLRVERLFRAGQEVSEAEIEAIARLHNIAGSLVRLSDVKMIALVQPEHAEQVERHFNALRVALKNFGLWYGRYPYRTITVVDPPFGAGGAGGMEYPAFITAGTSYHLPADSLLLEMVSVHEFGHQFWMQLVATNEFEESWLDEGFTTYSTGKIMDSVFGGTSLPVKLFDLNLWSFLGLPRLTQESLDRAAHLASPVRDDLVRHAWQYYDSSSYSVSSYSRTGVALRTLERTLGFDVMARVMRTYHQRWRFRHPTSRDFEQVVNEVSGRDMGWFFDQFVFGNRRLDYRVSELRSEKQLTPFGVFEKDGKLATVSEQQASKKDEEPEKRKNPRPVFLSTVKVERLGDAVVPVEVEVHFTDGHIERRAWDGVYLWAKFTFSRGAAADWAQIDPARKYQLDLSYANNSRQENYNAALSARWSSTLLFWLQNTFLWLSTLS